MQSNYNTETEFRKLNSSIWKVFKTSEPHPRSMAAAVKRTGKSKAALLASNDNSKLFARHRITLAAVSAVADGVPVTRGEIERRSGCSPHTVNKHHDIWKENLYGTIEKVKTWTRKYFRNAIQWLQGYVGRFCDARNIGGITHLSRLRKHQGGNSLIPHQRAKDAKRLDSGIASVYRHPISLSVVQAVNKKVGPAGVPPYVGENNDRGFTGRGVATLLVKAKVSLFFASLSRICSHPDTRLPLRKEMNTAARSRAAKIKPGSHRRPASFVRQTNTDTGEVTMHDRYVDWRPSFPGDRPPGSPFGSKESASENKPPALPRVEKPPQSVQSHPDPSPAVPCPPEIKELFRTMMEKMTLRTGPRKQWKPSNEKLAKMSHLERLEYDDSANENWFQNHQRKINQIFQEQVNFTPLEDK